MTHRRVLWPYFSSPSLPGCSRLLRHLQQATLAICCFFPVSWTSWSLCPPSTTSLRSSLLRGLQSCRNWKQESVCSCSSSALLLGEIALCHSTLLPELQWSGCRGVLRVRGARPEKCFIVQTQGQAMGNRLPDRHHGLHKCYFHLTWPFIVLWNDWKYLNGIQ